MKAFAALYRQLDQTNKTTVKVALLADYFRTASDEDKVWVLALFTGRRIRGSVKTGQLREWATEMAGVQPWLFEECYSVVGDLAETIALILPPSASALQWSLGQCMSFIRELQKEEEVQKKVRLIQVWSGLESFERFVFNKLLTGGFRIGVSQKLICKALSEACGIDENNIAHRLMGNWSPEKISFEALLITPQGDDIDSRPYPFCLAHPLDTEPEALGDPSHWCAEWKWDGIRGQMIVRGGQFFLWSRGEELVNESFPDLIPDHRHDITSLVLDGEILAMKDGYPLPFQHLQRRLNRSNPGTKMMQEVPVQFMAYDLLEHNRQDLRAQSFRQRRSLMEQVLTSLQSGFIQASPVLSFASWEALSDLRSRAAESGSEGIMLKHLDGQYETGRKKGVWWKWKSDPLTIDAVMIYAQAGHGRRASLFTDYTFALWDGDKLVPFAKAYSGLTDEEIRKVDAFVKANTREKFGPVRSVDPQLVFELGFEGVSASKRHKSGIAVRFPRILRWRRDKTAKEANTLQDLKQLIIR